MVKQAVTEARGHAYSWRTIGSLVSISGEAAQQRYSSTQSRRPDGSRSVRHGQGPGARGLSPPENVDRSLSGARPGNGWCREARSGFSVGFDLDEREAAPTIVEAPTSVLNSASPAKKTPSARASMTIRLRRTDCRRNSSGIHPKHSTLGLQPGFSSRQRSMTLSDSSAAITSRSTSLASLKSPRATDPKTTADSKSSPRSLRLSTCARARPTRSSRWLARARRTSSAHSSGTELPRNLVDVSEDLVGARHALLGHAL